MKYIAIVWIVVIAGALGWASITRVSSLFQDSEPVVEATSRNEGISEAAEKIDRLLRNSPGRGYRAKSKTEARVLKVLDGDTIEVEIDGERILVSYLGVETPEVDHLVLGTEPFGEEALNLNRELVEGKTVLLEKDIFETDRDGHTLRYVYLDDVMINAVLLHEGLAKTPGYARGLKYAEILYSVQSEAMTARNGGWRNEWPNIIRTR